jgi:hypothetical protein
LYDLTGRALMNQLLEHQDGSVEVELGNYPTGVYIVVIKDSTGIRLQQKLVKE